MPAVLVEEEVVLLLTVLEEGSREAKERVELTERLLPVGVEVLEVGRQKVCLQEVVLLQVEEVVSLELAILEAVEERGELQWVGLEEARAAVQEGLSAVLAWMWAPTPEMRVLCL